jgi:hypothetical protein
VGNIEKELQNTKEYLLLPHTGLAARMENIQQTQNQNIATFQTDTLAK